jgi:ribosomal protein S3AE
MRSSIYVILSNKIEGDKMVGHVARMREMRDAYKSLVRKPATALN